MLTWRIWISCPNCSQPRFRARDLLITVKVVIRMAMPRVLASFRPVPGGK